MARGSRLARLAALGLLGVLTLSGCDMPNNTFWRFGWPEGITEQATEMRQLWTGSVIAALIVGFLVWGLILYSVVRPTGSAATSCPGRRPTTCRSRSPTRSPRSSSSPACSSSP